MIKFLPKYENFKFLAGDMDSFDENPYQVFVLMPFGNDKQSIEKYSSIFSTIKNTIENGCFHGGKLSCSRADQKQSLVVMDDICLEIKKAGLTIFEISNPNPNVYFELGLACALDKKVILLHNPDEYYKIHDNEKIPFDINQFRYIEYHNEQELQQKLKRTVESVISLQKTDTITLESVYRKLQKITRHLGLDSKAEQIAENFNLSDYEIDKTCDVLDEYWNNGELEAKKYKGIRYSDVEMKIRTELSTNDWKRIKYLLEHIYWNGQYQSLIANLEFLPAELKDVERDWRKKMNNNE